MSLQEQRRAKFEEWMASEFLQGRNTPEQLRSMRDGDDYSSFSQYAAGVLSAAWSGYNAALESVVVELPPMCDNIRQYGYDPETVHVAIEATGAKVKS